MVWVGVDHGAECNMIKHTFLALFVFSVLSSAAGVVGYLYGHETGFAAGRRVGQIEAYMSSKGMCFIHHGGAN